MKEFINIRLKNWHFYLLGLVLINWGTGLFSGYSLHHNLIFVIKALLYLTGLILFFSTLIPFKKIAVYYSFYAISGVLTGLFVLSGGIFFTILSSLVLYPIFPKQTAYKTETIRIYSRFQGFMAGCCSYEVVEPKLYLFEKHLGYIQLNEPIDGEKNGFEVKNNTIIYRHELDDYGQTMTVKDTTEIINFQ